MGVCLGWEDRLDKQQRPQDGESPPQPLGVLHRPRLVVAQASSAAAAVRREELSAIGQRAPLACWSDLADQGAVERSCCAELLDGFTELTAQVDLAGEQSFDLGVEVVDGGGRDAVPGVVGGDFGAERSREPFQRAAA
jgi:hypothetical protein